MVRRVLTTVAAMALATFIADTSSAADPGFKVVVNSSLGVSTLTVKDASRIFLKKMQKWPGGPDIRPVDLEDDNPIRASFSKTVHKRSTDAIRAFWQKQIFTGTGLPPSVKASEADVLAFVESVPGAIGYVSSGTDTGGLAVVRIE